MNHPLLAPPAETAKPKTAQPACSLLPCVESGTWTPCSRDVPRNSLLLKLKKIDPKESRKVKKREALTFHTVGCTGDFSDTKPGRQIGQAMTAQLKNPTVFGGEETAAAASFLYHLGDIAYKPEKPASSDGHSRTEIGQDRLYAEQFYKQFGSYRANIFAIPGNHDAKRSMKGKHSAIDHFMENFCDKKRRLGTDENGNWRKTMTQPYAYWLLETPVAYFIGLATNNLNGGQLDDPMASEEPQYQWLVETLGKIREQNRRRSKNRSFPKAVILATHYPAYSGCANFRQRGNPNLGPTPRPENLKLSLRPLAMTLQEAFHESRLIPDLVLSAHAHLYQRITCTLKNGRQVPYLIIGCGGHGPIEKINCNCWQEQEDEQTVPFPAVFPDGVTPEPGGYIEVTAYDDGNFGFARLTVDGKNRLIIGEFFSVPLKKTESRPVEGDRTSQPRHVARPRRTDHFRLDLQSHRLC